MSANEDSNTISPIVLKYYSCLKSLAAMQVRRSTSTNVSTG